MRAVGDLFPQLLRKQPQKHLPVEEIVRSAWEHLAGAPIAARSRVFRLYNQTLTVHVPDPTWKRQLHRLEGALLARINGLLGHQAVTSIDFRVDETLAARLAASSDAAGPAEATATRKAPGREVAPSTEHDAAAAIADPELRELFLRASQKMAR